MWENGGMMSPCQKMQRSRHFLQHTSWFWNYNSRSKKFVCNWDFTTLKFFIIQILLMFGQNCTVTWHTHKSTRWHWWLFTGLTISMATKRSHPIGAFWARPLNITQHQRSHRERVLMGQQAWVISPGWKKGKKKSRTTILRRNHKTTGGKRKTFITSTRWQTRERRQRIKNSLSLSLKKKNRKKRGDDQGARWKNNYDQLCDITETKRRWTNHYELP